MQTNLHRVWPVRIATFVVFAVAAASAAFWSLKVWGVSQPGRAGLATVASAPPLDPQGLAQVLGGGAAALQVTDVPIAASSRFVLQGVVADTAHAGAALVAVDGKPAKPFAVGSVVDGRLLLQSVEGRRAMLASTMDGAPEVTLELPQPGK